MENVTFEVVKDGGMDKLIIEVDLNHRGSRSASGKTTRVASTEGNVTVKDHNGNPVTVGLNVYVK